MAAGESAYEVARKQREKAERLRRSAELWERGAAGEVAVADALMALPSDWEVMHDLPWPGRPRANIDHVVVGPGGFFVIDAKNWSGRVEVRDQVLRQNGRARESTVAAAAESAAAFQAVVPTGVSCTAVVCFVRDEAVTGWARDVMVCSTETVVDILTSRPRVLDPSTVKRAVAAVRGGSQARPHTTTPRPPARTGTRAAASSRGSASTRKSSEVRRAMGAVVFVMFLVLMVVSGVLSAATTWFADLLVSVVQGTGQPG